MDPQLLGILGIFLGLATLIALALLGKVMKDSGAARAIADALPNVNGRSDLPRRRDGAPLTPPHTGPDHEPRLRL